LLSVFCDNIIKEGDFDEKNYQFSVDFFLDFQRMYEEK